MLSQSHRESGFVKKVVLEEDIGRRRRLIEDHMSLFEQGQSIILILSTARATRVLKNTHKKPFSASSLIQNFSQMKMNSYFKSALTPFWGAARSLQTSTGKSRQIRNLEGFYQVVYTINK